MELAAVAGVAGFPVVQQQPQQGAAVAAEPGMHRQMADLDVQMPNPYRVEVSDDAPPRSRSRALRLTDILQHKRDATSTGKDEVGGAVGSVGRTQSVEM